MNGRDDEVWLDTLLQRQLPSGTSDEGFREQLLERLPPRERPVRRAFILGVTWVVAAVILILSTEEGRLVLASTTDTSGLVVPWCLATALSWYLVDRLT